MVKKYTCSCGSKVEKLTSYFPEGIRVTVCDECAERLELNKQNIASVDYSELKESKDQSKYDTRRNASTI